MSTNEFARILLTWIKSFLSWIGIPRDRLNELDEIIFLILIVVIAFAVGAVFHYLSVRFTRKVLKYKNISFLSSLIEYNALRKMSAVIPPLIISALLPFVFDYRSTWFTVSEKITWIYFFIALLFSVNAVLPILCLGNTPVELAPMLLEYQVTQAVGDLATGQVLSDAAVAAGKTLTIHVKLDTGR